MFAQRWQVQVRNWKVGLGNVAFSQEPDQDCGGLTRSLRTNERMDSDTQGLEPPEFFDSQDKRVFLPFMRVGQGSV